MKASELTVKCLENENVDYIFGIPGEENLDLMDALLESKIQFIQTRDERGCRLHGGCLRSPHWTRRCLPRNARSRSHEPCHGSR